MEPARQNFCVSCKLFHATAKCQSSQDLEGKTVELLAKFIKLHGIVNNISEKAKWKKLMS